MGYPPLNECLWHKGFLNYDCQTQPDLTVDVPDRSRLARRAPLVFGRDAQLFPAF